MESCEGPLSCLVQDNPAGRSQLASSRPWVWAEGSVFVQLSTFWGSLEGKRAKIQDHKLRGGLLLFLSTRLPYFLLCRNHVVLESWHNLLF